VDTPVVAVVAIPSIHLFLPIMQTVLDVTNGLRWVHAFVLATDLVPAENVGIGAHRAEIDVIVRINRVHNSDGTHTNDGSNFSFSILTNFFNVALPPFTSVCMSKYRMAVKTVEHFFVVNVIMK
jgi:hypothetical protein